MGFLGVATVLIPARVAKVLNLDESVVQPSVRSSASSRLNGITKPEQTHSER